MEREVKVSEVNGKVWIELNRDSTVSDFMELNCTQYEQLKTEIMHLESNAQRNKMNRQHRRLNGR